MIRTHGRANILAIWYVEQLILALSSLAVTSRELLPPLSTRSWPLLFDASLKLALLVAQFLTRLLQRICLGACYSPVTSTSRNANAWNRSPLLRPSQGDGERGR